MLLTETIESLLQPYLEEGKYFVVSMRVKPGKVSQHIMILLDSDEGITIQECASISRRLGNDMETQEVLDTPYTLEVSSPGLDQPLLINRQYLKNIGRDLKVSLLSGEILEGTLTAATDTGIVLELPKPKKKSKVPLAEEDFVKPVAFEEISKAFVQISFK